MKEAPFTVTSAVQFTGRAPAGLTRGPTRNSITWRRSGTGDRAGWKAWDVSGVGGHFMGAGGAIKLRNDLELVVSVEKHHQGCNFDNDYDFAILCLFDKRH